MKHAIRWPALQGLAFTALIAAGTSCGDVEGAPVTRSVPPPEIQEGDIAIVGVTVASMVEEGSSPGQTVVVSGDRITWVGPSDAIEVPAETTVIDGTGRTLLPGLGEMHAHVPSQGGRDAMARVMFLYLSQGVTTVRGMLGQPAHLELRADVASGDLLGPRLYTTGPSLNGGSIPDADSAARAVRTQHAAGYDLLKIHPGLSRASYDAIAATAHEVGIPFAGHVPAAVGLGRALEAQQASIDHLDQYMEAIVEDGTDVSTSLFFGVNLAGAVDEAKLDSVARATAEAGMWNVPTQSLLENIALPIPPEELAARPEMRYWPPQGVAGWVEAKTQFMANPAYSPELARAAVDVKRRLIKALHDAGAPLLLGSDAPQVFQVPGFSIQQELEIMVEAGLTPYGALRAGTYNVADYFGTLADLGTVESGKIADLLLVEGDPLTDISTVRNVAGVMAAGRWVSGEEIHGRLEAIAHEYGH